MTGGLHHIEVWVPDLAGALTHRCPHAGGPESYAAYLEDSRGFEVEIVANL